MGSIQLNDKLRVNDSTAVIKDLLASMGEMQLGVITRFMASSEAN
jgi:hypothetical protein